MVVLALLYKAFKDGTEDRAKAGLEGEVYHRWEFNNTNSSSKDWRGTSLSLSMERDSGKRYLRGVVGYLGTVASMQAASIDAKTIPTGTKKVTISLALAPEVSVVVSNNQAVSSAGFTSSVAGSSESTTSDLRRYCKLPTWWESLPAEKKALVDPDPYWCMKPSPPVPTRPVCPPYPSDWPQPTDGREIMLYPRPDWCIVKTPTPTPQVSGATAGLGLEYKLVESDVGKGTVMNIPADGKWHEYSFDLDSLTPVTLTLLKFSFSGLSKNAWVKVNWIRVTGPKKSVVSITPSPTDKDGCIVVKPPPCKKNKPCPLMPVQRICPSTTPTPKTCYWGMPPCAAGRACTQQMQWICPAPSGVPNPPAGCSYQNVQCVKAPCDPVLVCTTPIPVTTTLSVPPPGCRYVPAPCTSGKPCPEIARMVCPE